MPATIETTARYSLEKLPVWVKLSATLLFVHFLTGCAARGLPRGAVYVTSDLVLPAISAVFDENPRWRNTIVINT